MGKSQQNTRSVREKSSVWFLIVKHLGFANPAEATWLQEKALSIGHALFDNMSERVARDTTQLARTRYMQGHYEEVLAPWKAASTLHAPSRPAHLLHARLARLYRERAEESGDGTHWRAMCAWHDVGAEERWLRGEVRLRVGTLPSGARAVLRRPNGDSLELGTTPAEAIPGVNASLPVEAVLFTSTMDLHGTGSQADRQRAGAAVSFLLLQATSRDLSRSPPVSAGLR